MTSSPAHPVTCHPDAVGSHPTWQVTRRRGQLRLHYGTSGDWPQYGALHLRDSYLRLNDGPGCGWGTSIMLMPALWSREMYHHGGPVESDWRAAGKELELALRGTVAGLPVRLRLRLRPPDGRSIVATVEARVAGTVPLDRRPSEAFRTVFLSSMAVSPDHWDCAIATAGDRLVALPPAGWLLPPEEAVAARNLGLSGGACSWKSCAPSVSIEALSEELTINGWVTPSSDPNDDNVGLWAAADRVLPRWSYRIVVTRSSDAFHMPG